MKLNNNSKQKDKMKYYVTKRTGEKEAFSKEKILQAIQSAMDSVGRKDIFVSTQITEAIVIQLKHVFFKNKISPTVEEIQDIVEKQIMVNNLPEVAKSYILYRDLHSRQRSIQNLLDIGDKIKSYLDKDGLSVNMTSEIGHNIQGLYKSIINEVSERYWMNEVYDNEIREMHINKDFHIHKSSTLSAYCVGWDLEDLLISGFTGVQGNVTCGPAKHLGAALGQIVNFIYTLTNEAQDGAVAFSSIDTYLAPFIRYDKLSYVKLKQEIQSFIYNLNVPTKIGGQAVFSNITLDLDCPQYMTDQAVIRGGKFQKEKYGEFQKEMDMFNRALFEVYTEGDQSGNAFSWPIPTYNIGKDFDWDNENLKGLWEMTGKYGIPYFANFINSDMNPEDARSMCCRIRIDNRELHKRGGGFFGANPLTGSIGYVTINLPRLGYQYRGDKEGLFKRLGHLMDVSSRCLNLRRNLIEKFSEKGMYPYSSFYLRKVKERTGKYWSNHFNTIGIIGMNELCLNYLGEDIGSKDGQILALEIMDFMNEKLLEYQAKGEELYNLEASPAEGATYVIARKDKEIFPEMLGVDSVPLKKNKRTILHKFDSFTGWIYK